MSSIFGETIRVSVFGQSHAPGIGCVVDGLPAGEEIDTAALARFLARRAPGKNALSTQRREADTPEFLSGVTEHPNGILRTCGAPLCAIIRNGDPHSGDYAELADKPRPGHADYTAHLRYDGYEDIRGGGHFSGRLTAPLCVAGGIAKQILSRRGIFVGAHIYAVHGICDTPFDPLGVSPKQMEEIADKLFPVIDDAKGTEMQNAILRAKEDLDSVGGIVECSVTGVPAGLGDPMFDGIENRISRAIFGIPAVKGISFGDGIEAAAMFGSENNDAMEYDADGNVRMQSNHAGGILGGITTGMPIWFRTFIKPTPSIAREQHTISRATGENAVLSIRGRHDPCIVARATPVIEAVTALVILDLLTI